jgi:hypothetical protein
LLDLATSHPNSKFVGVDIVDMVGTHTGVTQLGLIFSDLSVLSLVRLNPIIQFPSAIKPPNTEFHVASILDGLPMFSDNSFDLVQMRLFAAVLKKDQWVQTLTELKRVCRPGGFIQLVEIDYKVSQELYILVHEIGSPPPLSNMIWWQSSQVTGNQFVNTFTTKCKLVTAAVKINHRNAYISLVYPDM